MAAGLKTTQFAEAAGKRLAALLEPSLNGLESMGSQTRTWLEGRQVQVQMRVEERVRSLLSAESLPVLENAGLGRSLLAVHVRALNGIATQGRALQSKAQGTDEQLVHCLQAMLRASEGCASLAASLPALFSVQQRVQSEREALGRLGAQLVQLEGWVRAQEDAQQLARHRAQREAEEQELHLRLEGARQARVAPLKATLHRRLEAQAQRDIDQWAAFSFAPGPAAPSRTPALSDLPTSEDETLDADADSSALDAFLADAPDHISDD